MNIVDCLHTVTRLFLDTAPVIYYVEENERYLPLVDEVFDRLDDGLLTAVVSPVTLSECLVVPYRLDHKDLVRDFTEALLHGRGISFAPIDQEIARQAAELRARYNLRLADAFQVAVAVLTGCDAFLTNDATLERVTELNVIVLDELGV
jgi:predicted nucleic acid-binding protein